MKPICTLVDFLINKIRVTGLQKSLNQFIKNLFFSYWESNRVVWSCWLNNYYFFLEWTRPSRNTELRSLATCVYKLLYTPSRLSCLSVAAAWCYSLLQGLQWLCVGHFLNCLNSDLWWFSRSLDFSLKETHYHWTERILKYIFILVFQHFFKLQNGVLKSAPPSICSIVFTETACQK